MHPLELHILKFSLKAPKFSVFLLGMGWDGGRMHPSFLCFRPLHQHWRNPILESWEFLPGLDPFPPVTDSNAIPLEASQRWDGYS